MSDAIKIDAEARYCWLCEEERSPIVCTTYCGNWCKDCLEEAHERLMEAIYEHSGQQRPARVSKQLQAVAEAAEAYCNEVDAPHVKLGELMDRLRDAGYPKDNCPSCGREKARSAQDVGDGKCPKWYAVRDPDAERDCTLYGGPK